jgi:regulatory protein
MSNLLKYCATQERCHQDIRTKLIQHQVYGDILEDIIATLITEGFLNEERYAKAYVRGKYRMNKWGRVKILQGLKQKQISSYCIKKGMKEIDEVEYNANLIRLIEKKIPQIKAKNTYEKRSKLSSYLLQKGYHYYEMKEFMDDYLN